MELCAELAGSLNRFQILWPERMPALEQKCKSAKCRSSRRSSTFFMSGNPQ
jgi:hypothetical protein